MEILETIMKTLSELNIQTSIKYDSEHQQIYLNLETDAKSHLHLFKDGIIRGRYNYQNQIDLTLPIDQLIDVLCQEFNNALHGRNFCQAGWAVLCEQKGIKLNMYNV